MMRSHRRAIPPAVFGWATLACAGLLAALLAHWAIDVAGDYVLKRDSYDHIAHHSRLFVVFGACIFALLGTAVVVTAASKDVRRLRGALEAVLGSAAAQTPLQLIVRLVPITGILLVTMESADSWFDLGRLPSVSDAFGGSLPLGGAIAALAGAVAGFALWRLVRRLHASRKAIAAAIGRLLTRREAAAADRSASLLVVIHASTVVRRSLLANRRALRAPPLPA